MFIPLGSPPSSEDLPPFPLNRNAPFQLHILQIHHSFLMARLLFPLSSGSYCFLRDEGKAYIFIASGFLSPDTYIHVCPDGKESLTPASLFYSDSSSNCFTEMVLFSSPTSVITGISSMSSPPLIKVAFLISRCQFTLVSRFVVFICQLNVVE